MQPAWLGYLFACFAVGVACLGLVIRLALRRGDRLSRAFAGLYAALGVTVTSSLLLAFADTAPEAISATTRQVLQYFESIVGFYGVMLALPLLAHRIFGVESRRRERLLVGAVVATLGLQHVTEFALGGTAWDDRGDSFENAVLIAVVTYSFWVAYSRRHSPAAERLLASRVLALMVIGVPATVYDVTLGESWAPPSYPLAFCVMSVVVTWTLLRSSADPEEAQRPEAVGWGLSPRELEVAGQVARGLSNKEVAAALHISPNTVKTHLRAIFEKAGVQSRFELISRMSGASSGHPPNG